MAASGQKLILALVFYVGGVYASFLTWSILQERINTKPYGENKFSGELIYYRAPKVLNLVQAFFACIVGFLYTIVTRTSNPFDLFFQEDRAFSRKVTFAFFLVAVCSSLSSPLGYKSLNHVSYLVYLLAKSCKLLPVVLIHKIIYGTKFPLSKYIVIASVTIGVTSFTLAYSSSRKSEMNDGRTLLGAFYLVLSMLLDGLTNSTQDYLFKLRPQDSTKKYYKITGGGLMCLLNAFVFTLTLLYCFLFDFEDEIMYSMKFVSQYDSALRDIIGFGVCGAVGQIFVFLILEKFGSIVLTTSTVTRKMFSMLISVFLFGHLLNSTQWLGVTLVFGGISYEAIQKIQSKKKYLKTD